MSRITARRGRQGINVKLKSWKALFGLGLLKCVQTAYSLEVEEAKSSINSGHSRQAQASESVVIDTNQNDYCGSDWYIDCSAPCTSGIDSECAAMGENYICQRFTLCPDNSQIKDIPQSGVATPTTLENATTGSTPDNGESSSPSDDARWWLKNHGGVNQCIYSDEYPVQFFTNENLRDRFIFDSKGECCESYADACSPALASSSPTDNSRWWLKNHAGVNQCVYNDEYPEEFITNENLKNRFIFNYKEECCEFYSDACNLANSTGTSDTPADTPGMMTAPTAVPSALPTPADTTYYPTFFPTNGAVSIQSKRYLFGITAAFIALVF